MQRSIKVSLALATTIKQRRLSALLREIQSCTQNYINYLWTKPGKLDSATLHQIVGGSLSYRHRSNCLKVALETISSTRKAAKIIGAEPSRPQIGGAVRLSSLVAKIEPGKQTFDYVLKISGLVKGSPIIIPFKSHKRLNYWLTKPGAKLLQGCTLADKWAALWIEIPDVEPTIKPAIGIDIGINKLIVDSNGNRYGLEIKEICARVGRCQPGSKSKLRAQRYRKDYINREVKRLPWNSIGTLAVERLKNLKRGKRPNRSKKFRKAIAPWTYRQVITRIECLAQENRVRLIAVDPRNTSRTCPFCKTVAKESRINERFLCVNCGFAADADHVGAMNVLNHVYSNSEQSMVAQC